MKDDITLHCTGELSVGGCGGGVAGRAGPTSLPLSPAPPGPDPHRPAGPRGRDQYRRLAAPTAGSPTLFSNP